MKGVRLPDLPLTPEQQKLVLSCRWLAVQQVRKHARGEMADEIESQIWFALVRAAQTYQPEKAKFTTWFMWWVRGGLRKARLLAVPRGYRDGRQPPELLTIPKIDRLGENVGTLLAAPVRACPVEQAERCQRLLDLVRALPNAPGRVARLVWVDGLTYQQAAARLNLGFRSVKTFLSTARRMLREALERQERNERRKHHPHHLDPKEAP